MINKIIMEVFKEGSIYHDIIDSLLIKYNIDKNRNEIISEIAIDWLNFPDKVIKVYNKPDKKELQFYFIKSLRNMLIGKNGFVNKEKIKNKSYSLIDNYNYDKYPDDEDQSIIIKQHYKDIMYDTFNNCGLTWVEYETYKEYIINFNSYRKMKSFYNISKDEIGFKVKTAKQKINKYLDDNYGIKGL